MLFLYGSGDEDLATKLLKQIAPDIESRWLGMWGFKTPPLPEEGDVMLVMGAQALTQFKEIGIVPKNRAIQSMRETVVKSPRGGQIMMTYSPDVVWSDSANASLMRYDIALARRLIVTGSIQPQVGKYEWVTAEEFVALIDKWAATKKAMPVSVDLETMGFFPMLPGKEIVTIQVSNQKGRAWVLHMLIDVQTAAQKKAVAGAVFKLLNTPMLKVRGANLKFDLGWIWEKFGIECSNFSMDTLLVGSLLDENRSNGLSWHCKEHTDLGGYDAPFEKKYDKGAMEKVPKDDPAFLDYCGGDVDGALQVSEVQLNQLAGQPALARFYTRLLHPAVRAFEKVERRGLLVDTDRYKELENELVEDRDTAHQEAIACIPARLRAKHAKAGLKLSRPSLVKDVLFSEMGFDLEAQKWTAKGAVSTDKAHLQQIMAGVHNRPEAAEFIAAYSKWSACDKMLGTYVYGFLEHLRPDGRFHPTYLLYNGAMYESSRGGDQQGGTVTGRTSAKDPAVQTIPKHLKKGQKPWPTKLRRCFIAPEGHEFFECDFSQGELRVTACVANEKAMLKAYREGRDLHCVTGAGFADMSYEEFKEAYDRMDAKDPTLDQQLAWTVETFRQQAKSANFGLLYGMGAEGFMIYARDSFGVHMSVAEATTRRKDFFRTYPSLVTWHENTRALVRRQGKVVSPLGRVRHLPLARSPNSQARSSAERMAINSPIQSCLSDMCLLSIVYADRELESEGLQIVGMTHDSIYGYVPTGKAKELTARVTEIMATLPIEDQFGWKAALEFPADVKYGPSWGEVKKPK